jgi:nitric oxide dioxygenase
MKFTSMLASVIGLIERQHMFKSIIEDLGRRHARYGVAEPDYEAVGQALMWSLEQALAYEFTNDARSDWLALFENVREIMIKASHKSHNVAP